MSRNKLWLLLALVCALAVLVACGGGNKEGEEAGEGDAVPQASTEGPSSTAPAADVANAGKITGTINYTGTDPDTPIAMNADPNCLAAHPQPVTTQTVEVKDGKLADVFVYVKSGLEGKTFPAPTEAKTLDQQGCLYHPHVFGIQVGQPLKIKNSDAWLHNIHALPATNAEFNKGQPFQNMEFEHKFEKPEVMVHFKCDVHPWMSSYVGVVDNPYYAVSGEDGTFEITNLPPGTYTIETWHETMGTQTQQVTVAPNGTATVNVTYPAGGAPAAGG
jgi:plastocyanin